MVSRAEIPHCRSCTLRCNLIFKHLSEEEIDELEYKKETLSYSKGQIIYGEGNFADGIYVVYSGKVKIFRKGFNGKDQIVRFAKPGDILGYRAIVGSTTYYVSGSTLEESQICFVPKELVTKFMKQNINIASRLLIMLNDDLLAMEKKVMEMINKPVRERLAQVLLGFIDVFGFEEDGKTLKVVMTREDIANFAGTTPETTIRILGELRDEKIIGLNKKKISIENLPKLTRESHIND